MTNLRPLSPAEVAEAKAAFHQAVQDTSSGGNTPQALSMSVALVRRLFDTIEAHELGLDGSFKPLDTEQVMIAEFEKFHDDLHGGDPTAIGGRFTYTFVPTSIGKGITAHCVVCKGHRNCTDYDRW